MLRILLLTYLLLSAIALSVNAQSLDRPHAVIHFLRGANFKGSACRTDINLPNQSLFNLPLAGCVNYTIYSTGEIPVTLEVQCPGVQYVPASSTTSQLLLQVKSGAEYYVAFSIGKNGGWKELTPAEAQPLLAAGKNIQKQAESLDLPINHSVATVSPSGKGQATCFLIATTGYLLTNYLYSPRE